MVIPKLLGGDQCTKGSTCIVETSAINEEELADLFEDVLILAKDDEFLRREANIDASRMVYLYGEQKERYKDPFLKVMVATDDNLYRAELLRIWRSALQDYTTVDYWEFLLIIFASRDMGI